MKSIALIAEYDASFAPHVATQQALQHSADCLNLEIKHQWLSAQDLDEHLLHQFDGLWIGPGSPFKNMPKTLSAIQYARLNNIPLLGTCGGFQYVMIEIARNELGITDADHAEHDPYASNLFISELTCSLAGKEMLLNIKPGSKVAGFYRATQSLERYYCNFGVNPEFLPMLAGASIDIVGSDSEGEVRIVELRQNDFFVATLFVPQARSSAQNPHPLVNAFVQSLFSD